MTVLALSPPRTDRLTRTSGPLPIWTLLFCCAAVAVAALQLDTMLQFDRSAIVAGEWWRVLSGHWTHWSGDHLFWDLTTFGALGLLAEQRGRILFVLTTVVAAIAISAAVSVLRPDVAAYRGLSGIDSALFILVAVGILRDSRASGNTPSAVFATAAIVAFGAKLAWESATGSALFVNLSSAHFESLPLAHAVGAFAGACIGAPFALFHRGGARA